MFGSRLELFEHVRTHPHVHQTLVPVPLVSVLIRMSIVYLTVVVRVPDVALAGSHGHSG